MCVVAPFALSSTCCLIASCACFWGLAARSIVATTANGINLNFNLLRRVVNCSRAKALAAPVNGASRSCCLSRSRGRSSSSKLKVDAACLLFYFISFIYFELLAK